VARRERSGVGVTGAPAGGGYDARTPVSMGRLQRVRSKPKRMTRAKAERLVAALAAIAECEDGPTDPAFDDVRAAVEPWMEG
jgi:hypothetical protein